MSDSADNFEGVNDRRQHHKLSNLNWTERWKPIAAIIYLIICLFDFVIAPAWVGIMRESYSDLLPNIKELPIEVQTLILTRKSWQPLTLQGSGLIHISFGAILTGTILGRPGLVNQHRK